MNITLSNNRQTNAAGNRPSQVSRRRFSKTFKGAILALALGSGVVDTSHAQAISRPDIDPGISPKLARFYSVKPDFRRCAFPRCGGFFVKELNKKYTRCPDGTRMRSCYAATADFSRLGLRPDELAKFKFALFKGNAIISGVLRLDPGPGPVKGFAKLIVLEGYLGVSEAGIAQTPGLDSIKPVRSTSYFVRLADTGIRCITTPCFSIQETILNTRRTFKISGVDLNNVNASRDELSAAYQALSNGNLIAFGTNVKIPDAGPAGTGIDFVAKEFYLRVQGPFIPASPK